MRWWWPQVGQTFRFFSRSVLYSTLSQLGHLIHRPSGTWRRSAGSLGWILAGRSFSSPDMGWTTPVGGTGRGLCVECRGDAAQELGRHIGHAFARLVVEQLDDLAADHHGVGHAA